MSFRMMSKSVTLNDLERRISPNSVASGAHCVKMVEDVVVKKFTFAISSPDDFLVDCWLYANRVVDLWNNLPNDIYSFKCRMSKLNFSVLTALETLFLIFVHICVYIFVHFCIYTALHTDTLYSPLIRIRSTGTVHTSAKAHLISVTIRIRIRITGSESVNRIATKIESFVHWSIECNLP